MLMLEPRPQLEPELGPMPPPMPALPPMLELALRLGLGLVLQLMLMLRLVPKLKVLLIIMLKPEPGPAIELPHRLALRLGLAAPTMVAPPPALPIVQLVELEQQRRQQPLKLEPGQLVAHLAPALGSLNHRRLARLVVARPSRKAFD